MLKFRFFKILRLTMGESHFSSQMTKAMSATTEMAVNQRIHSAENQSSS